MPVLDVELISWVRDVIDVNPERHDQTTWLGLQVRPLSNRGPLTIPVAELVALAFESVPWMPRDPERPICQTAGCVAGWAAIRAAPEGSTVTISGAICPMIREPGGDEVDISTYAQRKMGLSDEQARYVFHGDREREEVLEALGYLIEHGDASIAELIDFCGDANSCHEESEVR